MSTRSNIAILLRPEDRNRDFETPMGTTVNAHGKKYLFVYCHNDGYPSGVGADLEEMFDGGDYDEALEYILAGDRSTTDLTYWNWRRERGTEPAAADDEDDMYQEEYLYIIEEIDGRLRVRQYDEYDEEAMPTNDQVESETEEWYDQHVTEADVRNVSDKNADPKGFAYACRSAIAGGWGVETEDGDYVYDVILNKLVSLFERDFETFLGDED